MRPRTLDKAAGKVACFRRQLEEMPKRLARAMLRELGYDDAGGLGS